MAVTGSNPAVHVRFFAVGFWCFGAQVAARAKRRVVRSRNSGSCEFGGWSLVACFFPRFFSMRVLRFIMLGGCWGQKHGFRPRRTGRAPEWPPKREMPVLASRALATDPNNKNAYWRLRVRIPLCTFVFICWLLVLWGASRSARKKASCARPHWRKLRVWGLAAGRLFFPIFFDACFAVQWWLMAMICGDPETRHVE